MGLVEKEARFPNCPLICKHSQNLFSVWYTFNHACGWRKLLSQADLSFCHQGAPLECSERQLILARELRKMSGNPCCWISSTLHKRVVPGIFLLRVTGMCWKRVEGRSLASWAVEVACLLFPVLAWMASLIFLSCFLLYENFCRINLIVTYFYSK